MRIEKQGSDSFVDLITEAEDGDLERQLDHDLGDMVRRMQERYHGSGGQAQKATLTLSISLKLDERIMEVTGTVDGKLAKQKRRRSVFFPTKDGGLSRTDPRQTEMDLGGKRPAKVIS